MMKEIKPLIIARSTLSRLPIYYCYLQDRLAEGQAYVSASVLAESLKLNPVQVRKDLASVSTVGGKPKLGFATSQLLEDMKTFLGYNNCADCILVGVGGMGRTLMQYGGFANYGLSIVAGFDISADLDGTKAGGRPIMHISKLGTMVKRLGVRIGIVTVPAQAAQQVADLMVEAGIKAIWNFAPTHINLPPGVLIKNENLAASLAQLATALHQSSAQ